MNTARASAAELARGVVDALVGLQGVDIAIFPPFPYLLAVGSILRERGSAIRLGAQDAYFEADGAYTGEVSIAMLQDCGVSVVLTGHSERRHVLGESETIVHAKTRAVLAAGLECILCIGERLEEREEGRTDTVNEEQLRLALRDIPSEQADRLTIAYEPVWAIGTGRTASPDDAVSMHRAIRGWIEGRFGSTTAKAMRIQYGGSVNPGNAGDLLARDEVDGLLVGGASLEVASFVAIARAGAAR